MDMNQYMGMFLDESKEHLQSLNSSLLELENDPSNVPVLDEIFRSAHTIKGMSATMGFTTIAELTHDMENVLDLLRKEQLVADHDIIDVLFQCVDTLEQLVDAVANETGETIDIKPLINKLNALASGETPVQATVAAPAVDSATAEAAAAQPVTVAGVELNDTDISVIQSALNQGMLAYELTVAIREGCLLKSARAYMVMSTLDEFGDVIKSVPPADDLEKENFEWTFKVIMVSDAEVDKIKQALLSISEIDSVEIEQCTLPEKTAAPAPEKPQAEAKTAVAAPKKAPDKKPDANAHHNGNEKKHKGGQSVRVDIDKLDTLLNLMGELVINKTRLEQIGLTHKLTDLVETIEQMDRVTTDLQTVVMKVRMVPVGQVFNRFPRMVRDLSHELNKEINLIIEGEETELDRTVIDEIGDPLVHLLRNSVDHGVEHADERVAKGKSAVGQVKLAARHEGNNVIIEVDDDGKGIDPDVIKRKVVEKGLLTQADVDKMEDNEIVRLIFLPGFSTAEVVTDVSGRGVGMDAVKTKIEALGGMVDVETKIDAGSKFIIRLPLTLAIIQALLVKVCEEIYAIPLGSIDSTINITTDDIKTIQNREVIQLRGQIIPIIRLRDVLHVPNVSQTEPDELFVVIVHMGEHRAGIIVDTLIGQQEIVIKSMGNLLIGVKVIAGATILGNGQVALILDVGSIM